MLIIYDSFSSQTWAILYLNETLIKSQDRTQPNDSPVRCQNQEYFQTHMNLPFSILKILIKSVSDVIKTTSSTFLKTSESEESIEHNIVFIKQWFHPRFVKKKIVLVNFDWILLISTIFYIWLESHLVGFCINFWSKFHLGTKSPMSGKKMSHWSSVFVK